MAGGKWTIAVVSGPNLNLMGRRISDIGGTTTLAQLDNAVRNRADVLGVDVLSFQANSEGALIDFIQSCADHIDGLIVNFGGYAHTSVALRDAIAMVQLPTIEVHLSNIFAGEDFRRRSLTAGVCWGSICGLGPLGYELALEALVQRLRGL